MARGYINHKVDGAQKTINPNRVPKKKKKRISRDDPRNNKDYLESSDEIYEIVDSTTEAKAPEENHFAAAFGEGLDPHLLIRQDAYVAEVIPLQVRSMDVYETDPLKPPTGLYMSKFISNEDGYDFISFTGTLTFDDVQEASYYEYVINVLDVNSGQITGGGTWNEEDDPY